jgi:hypothetical protein
MIGTRTYYCEQCKKCIDFQKNDISKCECGRAFGVTGKLSDYINMRKTWSGQTKVEFSQTTIDQDIKDRNNR